MRFIDLAIKDLTQVIRDVKVAIFLLVMPVGFTAVMGLAFNQPAEQDPRLAVGFIDQDGSELISTSLRGLLESSQSIRLVDLEAGQVDEARRQVENGDLIAVVVIPQGYGDKLLAGENFRLTFIGEDSSTAQSVQVVVQTAITRLLSAIQAARISTGVLEARQPFASENERQKAFAEAIKLATQAWSQPPFTLKEADSVTQVEEKPETGGGGYRQTSPGMIIQFSIFSLIMTSSVIVQERKVKALQRMLTTSIRRSEIIAGHLLSCFLVVFIQVILLVLAGQFMFKVNYLNVPVATLLVMVGLSAWIGALGLFIGVMAKVEEQSVLFSLIAMFLFTAFAGAWFPLDVTGKAFSTIGHLTPGAWAMDGLQNIVLRGQGLASVWLPAAILLAYAGFFFVLAVWQFKYE
jgi:ABC-2 type transport system permease protein